ncbi:MAG: DUF1328 domain-containing protein [Proteobacteria bacterium]|nr:DUF1328 domain-containing protein [Pseudomonadota bacterium]
MRRNGRDLSYASTFFLLAIVAAILGFTELAGALASIAKFLCILFVVLSIATLIYTVVDKTAGHTAGLTWLRKNPKQGSHVFGHGSPVFYCPREISPWKSKKLEFVQSYFRDLPLFQHEETMFRAKPERHDIP